MLKNRVFRARNWGFCRKTRVFNHKVEKLGFSARIRVLRSRNRVFFWSRNRVFDLLDIKPAIGGSVVQRVMGLPRTRKGHGSSPSRGACSDLVSFHNSELIDPEVLIKIRIATSHCLCDARNIGAMKTHPYSQTIWWNWLELFHGRTGDNQNITPEWTPW